MFVVYVLILQKDVSNANLTSAQLVEMATTLMMIAQPAILALNNTGKTAGNAPKILVLLANLVWGFQKANAQSAS